MTNVVPSAVPEDFLNTQVALLQAGDTEAISQRYAEDAVFARLDTVAHGRSEIKDFFDGYLAQDPEILGVDGVQVTEDTILYQARESLSGQPVTQVGTLVFRDGLVWRQTAGIVGVDPA